MRDKMCRAAGGVEPRPCAFYSGRTEAFAATRDITDCHSQFENWLRNDTGCKKVWNRPGSGRRGRRPLRRVYRGCVERVDVGIDPYELLRGI